MSFHSLKGFSCFMPIVHAVDVFITPPLPVLSIMTTQSSKLSHRKAWAITVH